MEAFPVLLTGDYANFNPKIGDSLVITITSKPFTGTAKAAFFDKKACVVGDEDSVDISCSYNTESFQTPGTGILSTLDVNQFNAKKTTMDGKPVLLDKGEFDAVFEIISPATDTSPAKAPHGGPGVKIPGKGKFEKADKRWTAV